MTERLRILIQTPDYFQTLEIMEKTLSDKNEPKPAKRSTPRTDQISFSRSTSFGADRSLIHRDLRDLDHVCCIWYVRSRSYVHVLPRWDLYDLDLTYMFLWVGSIWSRDLTHTFARAWSVWSAWPAHVRLVRCIWYAISRSYIPGGICMI